MPKFKQFTKRVVLEVFEQDYWETRERNNTSEKTFEHEYLRIFDELPDLITLEAFKKVILKTSPNTRTRKRYSIACSKLARFLEIDDTSLKILAGNYSVKALSPRELPSDEEIAKTYLKISNPSWRWVFGVMAAYGIRNHEAFYLDLKDFPIAYVSRGKTGERYCYPLYPEWAQDWQLHKVDKPKCYAPTNSDLGHRVTKAFIRQQVGYAPYNLRHAWAIRSIDFNLDISLAAAMMGHSEQIHTRIYRHWLTLKTFQKAYNNALNNPMRPLPPKF